jgi:WD40 repeat protein
MSRWCHVQFSRDGRKVATSGIRVAVWDAVTGIARVTDSLKTGGFPQPIDFSPESDRLAIGRPNGRVDVLDLGQSSPTLRRLAVAGSLVEESAPDDADPVISSRRRVVLAVAFSPDGQTVISGSSTHVGVWDIRQSRRVRVLSGHGGDAIDVALSADGRRIYSVDTSGVVRVWPLSTTSAVIRTPGSFVNMVPLRANADGSIIATVTSDQALTTIRLTHLTDLHQDVINTPARSLSNVPRFGPMAVSPDGLHLFELQGRSIRRWTVKSEQPVVVSRSENLNCTGRDATSSLTVSRGGSLLAFNHRNCVFVWDASTMKQLGVFTADTASIATDMVFRDEDTLIISTQDPARKTPSVIRVWNWRTNQVLRRVVPRPVVGQDTVSWWLTLSPDARRIALISRGPGLSIVSLWDGDLKVEVGRLPPGDFLALAFSADGRRIVSVSAQEIAVRVWDAERFRLLLTLPDTDTHSGGVAFTRAGQIVAGRTGGGLTIWETQIRRQ